MTNTNIYSESEKILIAKIWSLPPDKVSEIIDFVDFLSQRQQQQSLTNSITLLSEATFEKIGIILKIVIMTIYKFDMETTTAAFKEWNVAVNALENGNTIMLLRKGGIKEQGGNFTVAHQQVLLYPTVEHQDPSLLKPEYANQVEIVDSGWHPEKIKISSFSEITHIFPVSDKSTLNKLFSYHIWNEKFVSDRLKWKPQKNLYVLLLRTYKLSQVYEIFYQPEYGGCRSWINLTKPINITNLIPVLNNDTYQSLSSEICQIFRD
ncbi:DUF1802 family protein [Okeania sp.]|uniref:DUF1802 family protein n=1 Tax=Okeania sp. TaxID=3100323 RepID=UPI002B4AC746|nr:DUF1802 family protein [Okeania sp.]MEB3340702.1 DUF1802 family protein [Okeania sp.]